MVIGVKNWIPAGDLRERPVPVVQVKDIGVNIPVGDEQVQITVAIIVQKAATSAPAVFRAANPGLGGDIRECAVAVIPVEDIAPPVGDEEVVEAVVVEVPYAAPLAPTDVRKTGIARYIGESAVAIIMEEITSEVFDLKPTSTILRDSVKSGRWRRFRNC